MSLNLISLNIPWTRSLSRQLYMYFCPFQCPLDVITLSPPSLSRLSHHRCPPWFLPQPPPTGRLPRLHPRCHHCWSSPQTPGRVDWECALPRRHGLWRAVQTPDLSWLPSKRIHLYNCSTFILPPTVCVDVVFQPSPPPPTPPPPPPTPHLSEPLLQSISSNHTVRLYHMGGTL